MNRTPTLRITFVALLTTAITLCAYLMIGPQILIIVPMALVAGIVLAFRRSSLSLVCFGYPLTFGLASAYVGFAELDDYAQTSAFAISIGIGLLGVGLITVGLWRSMTDLTTERTTDAAKSSRS